MLGRWLQAIVTIVVVLIGSRPVAEPSPVLDRTDSELVETISAQSQVRSPKRAGMRGRDLSRSHPNASPPALPPQAVPLPGVGEHPIDEHVAIVRSGDHRPDRTASARAPPAA